MVEVELRREQVWRSERESGAWLALGWAPGSTGQAFLLYTRTAAPPPPPPSPFILTHTLTDPPHPAPTGVISGDTRQHCSSSYYKLLAYFLNSFVAVLLSSELPELPPLDPIDH